MDAPFLSPEQKATIQGRQAGNRGGGQGGPPLRFRSASSHGSLVSSTFTWGYLGVSQLASVGVALLMLYANQLLPGQPKAYTTRQTVGSVLSLAPIITVVLALGAPAIAKRFSARLETGLSAHRATLRLSGVPALVTGCFVLHGLFFEWQWDPLTSLYVMVGSMAVLGSLRDHARDPAPRWSDAVCWLFLFIPLDLRQDYVGGMWLGRGSDMAYDWWAATSTLLMLLGFGALRRFPYLGCRLVPRLADWGWALFALGGILATTLPIGFATGFVKWAPKDLAPAGLPLLAAFAEIFMTVALTEELFFRGALFGGLSALMPDAKQLWGVPLLPLLLSSLAFGAMHWPRRHGAENQGLYALQATIAGIFLGITYCKSGWNVLAGALAHAVVDTTWAAAFGG